MNHKQSNIEKAIPAIYKRSALNHLLFGFVLGCRATLPNVTIKQAVAMFMEKFDLDDNDFNSDTASVVFDRMQGELRDMLKGENNKTVKK
jgi:hypothetical protein